MEKKSPFTLLEFDKLLEIIASYCRSTATANLILEIRPLGKREEIEQRQGLISEILRMSDEGSPLRISSFPDVIRLISKVKPEGAVLEAGELAGFVPVLSISSDLSDQIMTAEGLPLLKELTAALTGFPDIMRLLKRSVDSEGNILDSASALLAELREKIRRLDSRIKKKLEELVRDERVSVFLQDDFITKRSGRWVIPVRMDSKGQISGVVHDVSNSGETAFVEPLAIIGLANELENLVAEQKAEEIRILRSLSSLIRREAEGIDREYKIIVHLDLLNSVAEFSVRLDMEIPSINDSGSIALVRARHPLLSIALSKSGNRSVVPLDLGLGGEKTVMVITGSNAGGKTISIKTIGLLLIMALSGMPVPAGSASSFPMIEDLLVDIGDEQSIESSLSTFSAHVSNISSILKNSGPRALVLIDELGTGTDPEEGAALACAVLKELRSSGGLTFATTHLSEIKGFVHRTEGMLNASMEFDRKNLTPLYRLRIGEPGQSYALETARRYGLPDSIVDSAKAMLGGVKVEFDNLISDLNRKRDDYENALKELERLRAEADGKNRLAEQRLSEAEEMKKRTLSESYREASEIVLETKKKMNAVLDELKKMEKEKSRERIREMKQRIAVEEKNIAATISRYEEKDSENLLVEDVRDGDTVFVKSLRHDALVLKVNRKAGRVKIRAAGKEIDLPVSDLRARKGAMFESGKEKVRVEKGDEIPSSRINLVGSRVDEALSMLEPFLNHASLAGLSEVVVIHGVGAGILSRAVRQHLEGHPLVREFRKGEKNEGGAGVTVVTLA